MRFARGELALALVFAGLGVLWIAKGVGMSLWQGFAPDSGFLPLVYGALLCALSLAALLPVLRAPADRAGGLGKPLLVLGALLCAVAALPIAGFLLTAFALLLFLYAGVERLPWLPALAASGAISGMLYIVFKTWLGVPLP